MEAETDFRKDAGSGPRPMRRDAEANLERILAAAAAVFAETGLATSIEVVAERAGVGLGTIYRRFPNKQALVDDLARRFLADVVAVAERHLEDPGDGSALTAYLWETGELLATDRGLVSRLWNVPDAAPLVARSRELQGRLLRRAQDAGRARPDLTAEDVAVCLWSVQGVIDVTRGTSVVAWRRHLELVIDGLAGPDRPLTHPPLGGPGMDIAIAAAPAGPERPGGAT